MTSAKPTLAVVGATGVVGSVLLRVLGTRDDIWGEVRVQGESGSAHYNVDVRAVARCREFVGDEPPQAS